MARYKSLLTVTTNHTYYESGVSTDLVFTPLADSIVALRRQRGFIKKMPAGLHAVLEVQPDDSPVINFTDDLQLIFTLQPSDASVFFGITDLDQTLAPARSFSGGCKMYFTNNGTALDYKVLDDIVHQVHELRFSMASAPASVNIVARDRNNNVVAVEYDIDGNDIPGPYILNADPDNGSFSKKLDLSKMDNGPFTVTATNQSDNTDQVIFNLYLHDAVADISCAGLLELNIDAFNGAVNTVNYSLQFSRRSTDWKYLIVNRSKLALDEIDLVVTDNSNDDGSGVYDTYLFSGNPVDPDPGDQPDQMIVDGDTALIFTSAESIPFYEKSKTGIELKMINEGDDITEPGTMLIQNLPNPDPRFSAGETSTIYVYV